MGLTFISKLSAPAEIREQFPLVPELAEIKHTRDEEIKRVSASKNGKFAVIIGPCPADNEGSVRDYAGRLMEVQEKIRDRLTTIPRVYTSKPRTIGEGYMGMIHQPDPEKRPDMSEGILAIRYMHMRVLRETGFPTTDEVLYPENMSYLSGTMSYVAVGARSVENQFHWLMVSGCDVPVGMKSPTNGDLTAIPNFMTAAQLPHDFIFRGFEVQCPGSPLTHTILHGAVNKRGQHTPNYHYKGLKLLFDLYNKRGLQNPTCIVDANHVNSNKQHQEQVHIIKEVLHSRRRSGDIRGLVKGPMIESYIEPSSQRIGEYCYGKSITDPCLGWDDTERLLHEIVDNLG